MLCLNLRSTNPFLNLAVDEYLLKNSLEEYIILGINDPSVIIGKHQVAHREADTKYINGNNIPVVRRISGGGTVFHDHGNLNFSIISQSSKGQQVDFRKYTLPVIRFLATLGVEAYLEGKSDLKVNGQKISGNAEHVYRERVLHHGTLLFNTSLAGMNAAIRKDTSNYATRAVGSNPSPVINLREIIAAEKDINEFRADLLDFFLNCYPGNRIVQLTDKEISEIESLADSKYRTWEWNYAYGPEYMFYNRFETDGKHYYCRLLVKDGIIRECKVEGSGSLVDVADKLLGCRHMPGDILRVLREVNNSLSDSDTYRFF